MVQLIFKNNKTIQKIVIVSQTLKNLKKYFQIFKKYLYKNNI